MATNIAELKQQTSVADRKPATIFDLLTSPKVERGIKGVATQFLTPDRFLRMAINAVKKTPLLLQCDPQTVLGSFMSSAALGLEPNTIQQQAFLIPYKKRAKVGNAWVDVYDCQFQIGARGFVTLAHRSPYIDNLEAETIHENDLFEHMQGSESFLKFQKTLRDRGDAIGAFCYARLSSNTEKATVLPLEELFKIRARSETYKSLVEKVENAENQKDRIKAEQKLAETPWVMWFDDMGAKSAIKKASKQLPLAAGDAFTSAVSLDQDSADTVIDMAAMADPDIVRAVVAGDEEPPEPSAQQSHEAFSVKPAQSEMAGTNPDHQPSGARSETDLAKRMNDATTAEELEGLRPAIDEIPDPDAEQRLLALFVELQKKFARANQRATRGGNRPSAE